MYGAHEAGRNEGIIEGKIEGERIGEKRGKKRGEKLGEKRGKKKEKLAIAKAMLHEGLDLSLIKKLTKLDDDELASLGIN